MKYQTFEKGEKAMLIVYLPLVHEVEVIEMLNRKSKTRVRHGDIIEIVATSRLRKILKS